MTHLHDTGRLDDLLRDESVDPSAEAVWSAEGSLTREALVARVASLAHVLRDGGVRPGDRVAIDLEKSIDSVVAVLGVLAAGAAYVPLDPAAPPERSAYVARDAGARWVVTGGDRTPDPLVERGAGLERAVCLSGRVQGALPTIGPDELATAPTTLPARLGDDLALAYVLYTSGSTGRPKGVAISHRASRSFVDWARADVALGPSDRVTSHAPLHFDLSTFDLFASVAARSSIVLVPEKHAVFPVRLVALLAEQRVTCTYLVPSVLTMMLRFGKLDAHDLSALRQVIFAGEVFPIRHLRAWTERLPHARFSNYYGPTETNVCTAHEVALPIPADVDRPMPIGRACAGADVFVVTADGRLAEPGEEGELWARGACLADGYFGDPEKTAAAFVPSPFHDGERAYRTGDLVRVDPDGRTLHYVGRRDHMVKTRGYRVELGEVEATLLSHPRVREAVVLALPDDVVGHRLEAAVSLEAVPEDVPFDRRAMQQHCATTLPAYMIPEKLHVLPSLPLTSTGKIDRIALVTRLQEKER